VTNVQRASGQLTTGTTL